MKFYRSLKYNIKLPVALLFNKIKDDLLTRIGLDLRYWNNELMEMGMLRHGEWIFKINTRLFTMNHTFGRIPEGEEYRLSKLNDF